MVLGGASPSPPVEGTERLPTPKRRRSAKKLPYIGLILLSWRVVFIDLFILKWGWLPQLRDNAG
jgi:hypothetical protein